MTKKLKLTDISVTSFVSNSQKELRGGGLGDTLCCTNYNTCVRVCPGITVNHNPCY